MADSVTCLSPNSPLGRGHEEKYTPSDYSYSHKEHQRGDLDREKRIALKRLPHIDGHPFCIRRIVEKDQYCIDLMKQKFTVKRAIQNRSSNRGCWKGIFTPVLSEEVQGGREDQVLCEVLELYTLSYER